jgi:hypothetical protein
VYFDSKDRVIGRIGQSLELAPHLIPPPGQIGRNHSWLLFIWHLDRREGLSPPTTVLNLPATRCAQVSDPIRLPSLPFCLHFP